VPSLQILPFALANDLKTPTVALDAVRAGGVALHPPRRPPPHGHLGIRRARV